MAILLNLDDCECVISRIVGPTLFIFRLLLRMNAKNYIAGDKKEYNYVCFNFR